MEGGGRSNKAASCLAQGTQLVRVTGDEIAGVSSAQAPAGATVSATGWLWRTQTWHCPQHSREENAGPGVGSCDVWSCDACPWCDRRQQLAVLFLQQQEPS